MTNDTHLRADAAELLGKLNKLRGELVQVAERNRYSAQTCRPGSEDRWEYQIRSLAYRDAAQSLGKIIDCYYFG